MVRHGDNAKDHYEIAQWMRCLQIQTGKLSS
jgi:hypothetical protein